MVHVRTKANQEKHDFAVAVWARKVIAAGWSNVWSDLPGNNKPPVIGSYIPDIYAAHGGVEYVIEIETIDSMNTFHAQNQRLAFQRWASTSPNRKFEVKLA